jgi:hypothetical protein
MFVFSKSKIFKFLKRDCGTIPVAEIINGKIDFFFINLIILIKFKMSRFLCRSVYLESEQTFG